MFTCARVSTLPLGRTYKDSQVVSLDRNASQRLPLNLNITRHFTSTTCKMTRPLADARVVQSTHPEKIRMLVLETDTPHPDTKKEQGGFGEVLGELFKQAGDDHDPPLGIETVMQYVIEDDGGRIPKAEEIGDDIRAILITGSMYNAHGDTPWVLKLIELIKRMLWRCL
jgi:hypothetical protein